MEQVSKKFVRVTDEVVPLSHGQLRISFHEVGESCSPAIRQRIRARVKSHLPTLLLTPAPAFSVRERSIDPVSLSFLPPALPSTPPAADLLLVSQAAG